MTFEQFKTCVRAYFPGTRFYDGLVYLFPNDMTKHRRNKEALARLCKEFHLPYSRKTDKNFWKADPLVIEHRQYSWSTDEHETGDTNYSYSYIGDPVVLKTEASLLRLLKLAHDSNCFHYNKD